MTRHLFFALSLLSFLALAQVPGLPTRSTSSSSSSSGTSECVALDGGVCATTATMTLYVDPTGSNSNACTASGTSACATLAGALAKLPRIIRHATTVNVAAGTYAEVAAVSGFIIDKGITLAITGTTAQRTPTTGNVTGSVTASSTWSATAAPSITDSTQSWTANDLKGTFIKFTSGSLNGQAFPIQSNTATTLTAPFGSSAVTVGVTYELVTIAAIFTSSSSHAFGGLGGGGTLAFSFVRIERSTGGTWGNAATSDSSSVTCTSCDIRGTTTASSVAMSLTNGALTTTRSYFVSASNVSSPAAASSNVGRWTATSCYFRGTGNGGALSSSSTNTAILNSILEATSAGTQPVWEILGGVNSMTSMRIECAASVYALGLAATALGVSARTTVLGLSVNGCSYGLIASRDTHIDVSTSGGNYVGFNSTTTGVAVQAGGTVNLNTWTPTFSGVTNELQVDATNYTFSTLSGLTPGLIQGPYGSSIFK